MTSKHEHADAAARGERGRLIAIEGIDGTGKTTLAAELVEALQAVGRDAVLSSEPTRGPWGMKLRALQQGGRDEVSGEAEMELFIADRKWHLATLIEPALAAGRDVVLDRYYFSTMAYQGARGVPIEEIERRHREFAPEPDLLVILELPVEIALERIVQKRGEAPNAYEGREYLTAVQNIFDKIDYPYVIRLSSRSTTDDNVKSILANINEK